MFLKLSNIINFQSHDKKCCGNVTVSVFEDLKTGFHFFEIEASNDELLPVSYVIEDTLKLY